MLKFVKNRSKVLNRVSVENSLLFTIYRCIMNAGGIVIYGYITWRLLSGKEELARLGERLGFPGRLRPPGPLLWVHTASVGESLSALPLIETVLARRMAWSTLVTTCSVSAALLMKKRLPERGYHQYMPVDRPIFLKRFLDHWRPTLVLWIESEFWPNIIFDIKKRDVPLILINGRISERSFRRWQRLPQVIHPILAAFNMCLGQTEQDCYRLSMLGARSTDCIGNLKFASPPLPADTEVLAQIRFQFEGRPVWLAVSTHVGEEALVGRVHQRLALHYPTLLTLIAPRHPSRGNSIAAELAAAGIRVARRSLKHNIPTVSGVYIIDTIGELGIFFRLSSIVFVGKSLCGSGGQNPLEPARLGCAVLFGPHMANFADIAARMLAAGAARIVADEAQLSAAVSHLFEENALRVAMGTAGQKFATAESGKVLLHVLDRLIPYLDRESIVPRR